MAKDTKNQNTANKKGSKAASRRKRRRIIFAVEALVLIALLVVLFVVGKLDKLQKDTSLEKENLKVNELDKDVAESLDGYTTIALFGVDSRDNGMGKGTHSDAIMVASINNKTKDVKVVSVYRDTYLNQSNDTYNKANQAYFSGGPEQAISMLNTNLDLDIKEYVSVNFTALVDTIDLLGGIEIDVTEEEIHYLNDYQVETSVITGREPKRVKEAGLQMLNGIQATAYTRIRYTDGDDFKRTERQRLVLELCAKKAQKASLGTINKIVDKIFPQIETNFSSAEILKLAADTSAYNLKDNTGFPFDKTPKKLPKKGDCIIPKDFENNVVQLHEFLFENESYTPSQKVLEISKEIATETGIK